MTFNQYNVTTITEPYTASNEEYIISDGSTVTLPEPSENAIVAVVSRDGTRVPVEPNATELVEFDSAARVGTTGATYFVSDGTNWYLESGRENVFGDIPDSAIFHWKISEGSGSTLTEELNSQDGTINGPTWEEGNWYEDYALIGDGTDDYVDTTQWQSFGSNLSNNWAIFFTLETTDDSGTWLMGTANDGGPADTTTFFVGLRDWFDLSPDTVGLALRDEDDNRIRVESDTTHTDGGTYRICINKTGDTAGDIQFWTNGSEDSTSIDADDTVSNTENFDKNVVFFARRNHSGDVMDYMDGLLDNIIICDDSVSSSDISSDYDSQPWS